MLVLFVKMLIFLDDYYLNSFWKSHWHEVELLLQNVFLEKFENVNKCCSCMKTTNVQLTNPHGTVVSAEETCSNRRFNQVHVESFYSNI